MQLLIGQIVAVVVTFVYAVVVTFVLLKILDVTMGLRVSQEEEIQGLDLRRTRRRRLYLFVITTAVHSADRCERRSSKSNGLTARPRLTSRTHRGIHARESKT